MWKWKTCLQNSIFGPEIVNGRSCRVRFMESFCNIQPLYGDQRAPKLHYVMSRYSVVPWGHQLRPLHHYLATSIQSYVCVSCSPEYKETAPFTKVGVVKKKADLAPVWTGQHFKWWHAFSLNSRMHFEHIQQRKYGLEFCMVILLSM